MTNIRRAIKRLLKKHKTNDPFILAEKLNINIILRYMHHEINGFYKLEQRNRFIVINKNLSDEMQRFVCAHELGHAILHPEVNTPFFRKYTFFSVEKIEVEANTFAVELLIPDDYLKEHQYEDFTIQEVATLYGLPQEVAHLKTMNFHNF